MKKSRKPKIAWIDREDRERRALLAQVHIAQKELDLDDAVYRFILQDEFGVKSAGDLTNRELESLKQRFISKGWRPRRGEESQVEVLKERVGQVILHSGLTPARVHGLTRKICRVEDVAWCRDAEALKRLLAALGKIVEQENRR